MIRIILTILLVAGGLYLLFRIANRLVEKNPQKRLTILALVLLVAMVLVVFVPSLILWKTAKVFTLYSTIEKSLIETTGKSQWFVRGILTIAFIPFVLFWKWLFSLKKSRRRIARATLMLYTGGYYLAMYFLTQNIHFSHDGPVLKYYAKTPEGIRLYDTPGYDTKYGIKLEPITSEVAREYELTKGLPISSAPVSLDTASKYFTRWGAPNKWYAKLPDGSIELFDGPGVHPKFGIPLEPINAEVVQQVELQKQKMQTIKQQEMAKQEFQGRLSKYINSSATKLASKKSVLVVVADKGSAQENVEYESTLKGLLGGQGLLVSTKLFKPAFFSEGHFGNLVGGQSQILAELGVSRYVDYLLLIEQQTGFSQNEQLEGLTSSKITLDYQLIKSSGEQIKSGSLSEPGIGMNEKDAIRKALSNIVEKLLPKLKGGAGLQN
ncbi:MAG: hypothetical protein L0Y74_06920 [candidate division Zixibacteria bacterium]|nr:hypothetical protein [candidate division Zixibacteria bacterium]